jgi:hypothetical protein
VDARVARLKTQPAQTLRTCHRVPGGS